MKFIRDIINEKKQTAGHMDHRADTVLTVPTYVDEALAGSAESDTFVLEEKHAFGSRDVPSDVGQTAEIEPIPSEDTSEDPLYPSSGSMMSADLLGSDQIDDYDDAHSEDSEPEDSAEAFDLLMEPDLGTAEPDAEGDVAPSLFEDGESPEPSVAPEDLTFLKSPALQPAAAETPRHELDLSDTAPSRAARIIPEPAPELELRNDTPSPVRADAVAAPAPDAAASVEVPAPSTGRASRRAGRVKTRLLGFTGGQVPRLILLPVMDRMLPPRRSHSRSVGWPWLPDRAGVQRFRCLPACHRSVAAKNRPCGWILATTAFRDPVTPLLPMTQSGAVSFWGMGARPTLFV